MYTKTFDDTFPREWKQQLNPEDTLIEVFPTLAHFKQKVKGITQKEDSKCGISYANALKALLSNKGTMSSGEYKTIKNRVANNLMKRGLISDTVYESYKYDVEGDIIDVNKVIQEDPMCCLVPNKKYTDFFYELYISISYPYTVPDSEVIENMAKILATIELLEKKHYYCKVSLIFPDYKCNNGEGKKNYMAVVPLFSHKDVKTIEVMSSVLNERLLRKFFFAILEDTFGNYLDDGYGQPIKLDKAIIPVDLDECALCANILEQVMEKGTR